MRVIQGGTSECVARATAVFVPEGRRKLAGGEASPRAGTTGPSEKNGPAPEGRWIANAVCHHPSGVGVLLPGDPVVALVPRFTTG